MTPATLKGEEMMKKLLRVFCSLLITLTVAGMGASGQPADTAGADHTAPSYDMKAQALLDLERVQKKFVDLANAVPSAKFGWRPSDDSRSFAEVFLHAAGERYGILKLVGATVPDGFDPKKYEKSTTDKVRIVEELNKSWEFAKMTINGMSNADFAKLLPKLGPQANAGDVVYILVADAHEHLGQSVAYARVNGITPPWTVAAQKQAPAKKAHQQQ
jgi:DinB superfamily